MKYGYALLIVLGLQASSGYAQDTVYVKTGWNLIGSVIAGPVLDVLSTIPDSLITSSFFGYTPGFGYESTDTLKTGLGYWVKAKSDGQIVFNNTPPVDSCKSKAFIYEGKLYHTVKIGEQCWMAENLDVGVMIDSLQDATDNDTTEKYCYSNDPANCVLYGGLYQWDEAMQYSTTPGDKGICPPGWHIPTFAEFESLILTVGGYSAGHALKALGQESGTNTSGFSALLAGKRAFNGSGFSHLGLVTVFWGSTVYAPGGSSFLSLTIFGGIGLDYSYETYGHSVRCIED